MADNSEETVDKSGVKIVVTEVSVEGEQADDDDVNIKSADQSLDMSHDTSGPIADPDISVQVHISTITHDYYVLVKS
jgi:hypothetical protein